MSDSVPIGAGPNLTRQSRIRAHGLDGWMLSMICRVHNPSGSYTSHMHTWQQGWLGTVVLSARFQNPNLPLFSSAQER